MTDQTSSTVDFSGATWRKSTRSGDNGACVEVARSGDSVGIRDSKDPSGPVLTFTRGEFAAFLTGVTKDDFSSPI